jgi:hypothetical protein
MFDLDELIRLAYSRLARWFRSTSAANTFTGRIALHGDAICSFSVSTTKALIFQDTIRTNPLYSFPDRGIGG